MIATRPAKLMPSAAPSLIRVRNVYAPRLEEKSGCLIGPVYSPVRSASKSGGAAVAALPERRAIANMKLNNPLRYIDIRLHRLFITVVYKKQANRKVEPI